VTFETETSIPSQRSGGSIPEMYLALVDKYGQIVSSDDDSKIQVMIDAIAAKQANINGEEEANKFPPFIEGNT